MGVSRVLQTSTPKLIRGGQVTSERRTVSAVSESPVDAVTTVQRASLSVYCRHLSGRRITHKKTYNSPAQAAAKLCALSLLFSVGTMNYNLQTYHRKFILTENNDATVLVNKN